MCERFSDVTALKTHTSLIHFPPYLASKKTSPRELLTKTCLKSMSVAQLKIALKQKGLSATGKKDVLVKKLEGITSI